MMEKRSMVLLTVIALATLLVAVVGATFAYFTATSTDTRQDNEGKGGTSLTTATVANVTTVANVDGAAGSFTVKDVYPGHQEVAALSVEVNRTVEEGDYSQAATYSIPFIYKVDTNTISTAGGTVNYYLYSVDADSDPGNIAMGCNIETKEVAEKIQYSENCTGFTHAASIGESTSTPNGLKLVAKGSLAQAGGAQSIQMTDEITIQNDQQKEKMNYYFVVEYKKEDTDQNAQMGQSLTGTITVAGAKANP